MTYGDGVDNAMRRTLASSPQSFSGQLLSFQTLFLFAYFICFILNLLPVVLWLGVRKSIRPVNTAMRCWCGYLSGARCRLFAWSS